MERRKALAVAGAATALVGSGIVAAAAFSGASLLGFGGSASAHPSAPVAQAVKRPVAKERLVVRTRNVYDRVVVETTTPGTAARVSEPTAGAEPESTTTPTIGGGTTHRAEEPSRSDDGIGVSEPSSSVAPAPAPDDSTTSVPTTAPGSRPPGVPDDWPAGKPIPPMPPNCQEPQLHLNGVWECSGTDN